jgi:hypothetical protein
MMIFIDKSDVGPPVDAVDENQRRLITPTTASRSLRLTTVVLNVYP